MCGNRDGITQVSRTVPVRLTAIAHRADHNDRFVRVHGAVEKVCRLLKCIRSMRHHDAADRGITRIRSNDLGKLPHPIDGDVRSGKGPIFMDDNLGHVPNARDAREDLPTRHTGNYPAPFRIKRGGDRSAGEDGYDT